MKQTITLLAAFLLFFAANAQTNFPCGTDFLHQQALQNPAYFQKHHVLEQEALEHFSRHAQSITGRGSQVVTVPVVVHIVHDNGPENLTDAAVQQAISWLNQAFANSGYYAQGSGTDVGIQFCLAQRRPDGQAANGITRDQSALTELDIEPEQFALKNLNRWNPKEYINIWVVRTICSTVYGCGISAFAYYPSSHGSSLDGIVIEASYLSSPALTSVLAHELGHYFGLYHTFEGGCTNYNCLVTGDRVCDTPPDQSTAAVPCDQPPNTCSTDTQSGFADDQPDMIRNFLDYGGHDCQHDFTPGQAARMDFYLNGTRKSLLASKGCLPPCPLPVTAAFSPGDTTVLAGQTLLFDNNSQNAVNFLWTINGTQFGGQQNAAYLFDSVGVFTVQLVAQPLNAQLCEADSAQVTVQVTCPVVADFTLSNLTPEEGEVVYISNNSQNANAFEWFVNGVSQGAVLDSLLFKVSGSYEIRLVAVGGFCSSSATVAVFVRDSCTGKTFMLFRHENSPTRKWRSEAAVTLADGNLLFSGGSELPFISSTPAAPFPKDFFIKTKPDGTILWSKLVGRDSLYQSICSSLVATADSGFAAIITHYYYSDPIQTPPYFLFLVKFSSDGEIEWTRMLSKEFLSYFDMIVDKDDENLIVGNRFKFDLNGNLLWQKKYTVNRNSKTVPYPTGGFISVDFNDFDFSLVDSIYIARYEADGNVIWGRTVISSSTDQITNLIDAGVGSDGSIFILGELRVLNFISYRHALLVKLTPNGEFVWARRYLRSNVSKFIPETLAVAPEGVTVTAYVSINNPPAGGISYYWAFLHTDYDGSIKWLRHYPYYGGNITSLNVVPGGGYIGTTTEYDMTIFKTDPLGYIGDCPSIQRELHYEDEPVNFEPFNFTEIGSNEVFPFDSLPMEDYPIVFDTFCTPACPRGQEICNNNLDDDNDGLFDCLDPDCDCAEDVCAPGEANIWYFGNQAGLDFSTEPPTVLVDGQTFNDCCASATVSDAAGNLLFYTDGLRVFNRFHQVMPNGNPFSIFSDREAFIIPYPGKIGEYYIFVSQGDGLRYSKVDMQLDNGLGDVVLDEKEIVLLSDSISLSLRMTAVKSCSFDGYWLICRALGFNSKFIAFRIDENGLNLNPIISSLGQSFNAFVQMKISPDGKRIVSAEHNSVFMISDFDGLTGSVATPPIYLSTPTIYIPIGFEFSPSGRYLYVSAKEALSETKSQVFQYDLYAGGGNEINNSRKVLATIDALTSNGPYVGSMQLAPNGKIYIANANNFFSAPTPALHIIHQPNRPAPSCQFQENGQPLAPGTGANGGLVNVVQSIFAQPSVAIRPAAPDTICVLDSLYTYTIEKSYCFQTDSILWKMEGLSGTLNDDHAYAWITFNAPGEGQLIVINYTECGIVADTLHIVVAEPFDKILDLGPDRVVCDNGVVTLNAGSGFTRYRWQDGSPDSLLTTLLPGIYWVDVWDACGNQQTDTVTVSVAPTTVLDLGDDGEGCPDITATFQRPDFFSRWRWSPADFLSCDTCASVTVSPAATIEWIVVAQTDDGCISVDTLMFRIQDTLFFELDTSVCSGQMLALFGSSLPADTTAQFFFPAPGLDCDTLLTVNILGLDAPFSEIEKTVCAGEFFSYNNVPLPADTTAVFLTPGAGGECDSVIVVRVSAYPSVTVNLPPDTTLRVGASLILKPETSGTSALNFQWSPNEGLSCDNCPDPEASPVSTTLYTLAVIDANSCVAQDSIFLTVDPACVVVVPNAFTPNGDGVNDWFYPKTDPCVRRVRVWRVVSRWGETVFERFNFEPGISNLGWDGNRPDGQHFPSDVLVWYAELEYYDGKIEVKKGDVALLR